MKRMSLKDVRENIFVHAEELDKLKSVMLELPERTKLKCEYCGWRGTKKQLLISYDHDYYTIYSCPECGSFDELEYDK